MRVSEIFTSLEGEGIRQGFPCSFVRFYGCPLHCSYCDTRYACQGGEFRDMSPEAILEELLRPSCRRVTLTGGEPLCAGGIVPFTDLLLDRGFEVNIETSGAVDYNLLWSRERRLHLKDRLIMTVDYKLPGSGMEPRMVSACFTSLMPWDVLKFVVSDLEDLEVMRQVLERLRPFCHIYAGAVLGRIHPRDIAGYLLEHGLNNVRLQLQLHKYVWDPDARGV